MIRSPAPLTLGLGGGCHWCTEAVFTALRGVNSLEQGFICADPPHDSWSEAVRLTLDPDELPLAVLIDIHLRTHASTSDHKMRGKYRSAVYVSDESAASQMRQILDHLQLGFQAPLVTMILPLRDFRASPERYRRYADKHAGGPFCTAYIDPKLALLRRDFAGRLQRT